MFNDMDQTRCNLGEVCEFLFCFAFLATMPGIRLARMTTPRSVKDVEVRSLFNLLVDQGGLLPVSAMECQLFM